MAQRRNREAHRSHTLMGRLLARPGGPVSAAPLGLQRLRLDGDHDALLYVPAGYRPEQPAPLALMLHGAGGQAQHGLTPLQSLADDNNLLLLSPSSGRQTWDLLLGGYGPDVAFIDDALTEVFGSYAVDERHVAIGGFSDGASYALSLGLTNGDLFSHIIAFSPGFAAPAEQQGEPRIYVSHGIHDNVLPVDSCSRRLVPMLKRAGYDVRYHEFDGPHTVPAEIAREALSWFLG